MLDGLERIPSFICRFSANLSKDFRDERRSGKYSDLRTLTEENGFTVHFLDDVAGIVE